jgi:hypothetical protein
MVLIAIEPLPENPPPKPPPTAKVVILASERAITVI